MEKMWAGRFEKSLDKIADDFNSSLSFDCKMYKQDVLGSIAHATMLGACGVITELESQTLIDGLEGILVDIENGTLKFDTGAEDIHMFVEAELTKRLGDVGKKLHTARSRNDQVATDFKLYVKTELQVVAEMVESLIKVIVNKAEQNVQTIMPGYTHLQRAQPISFAQNLLA